MFFYETPVPEGFVNGSIPTDEGTGGEEEGPEDGEAKARTSAGVLTEVSQRGDQVEAKREGADYKPEEIGKKKKDTSDKQQGGRNNNNKHCIDIYVTLQ